MELNKPIIDDRIDRIKRDDTLHIRTDLRAVFDSVMTCATQGLALRRHRDEEGSNIWNLVRLISKFNEDINEFLFASLRLKFMSLEIQN